MVVGFEIQKDLGLSVGDRVTFRGQEFTISKVHPERGSTDDVTVWINLAQAQEMLGMQNLINAILALECDCAGDRISAIREEISSILPGTQVVEKYSQALARAEARAKAKETAEAALAHEKEAGTALLKREEQSRVALENRHAGFAAVLVPLVLFASAATVFLLALLNARQRTSEIGILRAIGLKSRQIVLLFLSKATLIGLIGGIIGVIVGYAVGLSLGGLEEIGMSSQQLLQSSNLLPTLIAAPLIAPVLTGVASWVPAMLAAQKDPALVLQAS